MSRPAPAEHELRGQSRRWTATVRWRKGGFVGLKLHAPESLVATASLAPVPGTSTLPAQGVTVADLLARIETLERENLHLKKLNRELRARYEP